MDTTQLLLAGALAVLLIGGAVVAMSIAPDAMSARSGASVRLTPRHVLVTLDVVANPADPAAQRLAARAAWAASRRYVGLDEIVVVDRNETELGRFTSPPEPASASASGSLSTILDLPDAVRAFVTDADDPIDVIRAVMRAAGRPVEGGHGGLVSGDFFVTVVGDRPGARIDRAQLMWAFHHFRSTASERGLVIGLGAMDPDEVAARERVEPRLRHSGVEVLQRMADAAAIGGDPVRIGLAPLLSASA